MSEPENSTATSSTDITIEGQPLASRIDRLIGVIIDAIIVGVVAFILSLLLKPFGIPAITSEEFLGRLTWIVIFTATYAAINYKFLMVGQTVGKQFVGTRIVHTEHRLLPVPELILKRVLPVALIGLIPYVGPVVNLVGVLLIFGADQRCLHDLIAGTRVISAKPAQPA